MQIADILREKGSEVTTVSGDATMLEAIGMLAERRIGALPVSADGRALEGIVSERDVVRALADGIDGLRAMAVRELMTTPVHVCSPEATLAEAMALMNERRIRHVPVVADGALVGILSMRDLVDARLREAEAERQRMAEYIADPGALG